MLANDNDAFSGRRAHPVVSGKLAPALDVPLVYGGYNYDLSLLKGLRAPFTVG
jgi:hypothetical protein